MIVLIMQISFSSPGTPGVLLLLGKLQPITDYNSLFRSTARESPPFNFKFSTLKSLNSQGVKDRQVF